MVGEMLTVVDHTDPKWRSVYLSRGRENGAATYSREIVQHHLPLWEEWAKSQRVFLSTAPLIRARRPADVAIQYLHEYRQDPFYHARTVLRLEYPRVIFVASYEALVTDLRAAGAEAIYIPMAIDVERVQCVASSGVLAGPKRAAYFGNITRPKKALYASLRASMASKGWELDHVLEARSEPAWSRLRGYSFGVGVGRCALEMGALGLRVMLAGARFGGLMVTPEDVVSQRATNMNGRITTYSDDVATCIANWDSALAGVTTDVPMALDYLREALRGA